MSRLWFDKIPADRQERWQLMTDFFAYWLRPLSIEDQISVQELDEAEDRLELKLPAALREWYRLTGKTYQVWSRQDHWLSPEDLEISDQWLAPEPFLIFYSENQNCWDIGIKLSEINLPDPTVYMIRSGVKSLEESVSEFALHMLAYVMNIISSGYPLYGSGSYCGEQLTEQMKQAIEAHYVRTAFSPWYFWNWKEPILFYEGEDILIQLYGNLYSLTAKTEKAWLEFYQVVPRDFG